MTNIKDSQSYDVIIAGLGAMGSATAYHLARRGARVLGLDRFSPPHTLGSSHGQSRIIREAYYEGPEYVPLVQRAYTLWADLEQEWGQALFRQTGGIMIGPPGGELVSGALASARAHGLRHEMMSAAEVRGRFPVFSPPDQQAALWEPRAGVLFPEACVGAHLALARRHGAHLRYDEPAVEWWVEGGTVRVTTAKGEYRAGRLVLSAGAWLGRLVESLRLPLFVERQVLYWFEAAANRDAFRPESCPIFLWEYEPGLFFSGFPDLGKGFKCALHHQGREADPDRVNRNVAPEEEAKMRALLAWSIPQANGRLAETAVCLYTNTPDQHFLIDYHPAHPQVLIVSPCSGHGFKFSAAIGEVAAGLVTTGRSEFDLGLFGIGRLGR